MTKDDVMKFLETASPEVFSEIRKRMVQIINDRDVQDNLEKSKAKADRKQRICDLHKSGMTFKKIGEIFDISAGRCQQIHAKEMRWRKYKGLE